MINVKEHNLVVKDVEDVFLRADRKIKIATLANRLKKAAYGTQLHEIWPFGPIFVY